MKRLSTFVFALLLAGSLSFAQDTGKDTKKPADTGKAADSDKKEHKGGKKGHKGGKKGKKGASTDAATPPPK